MGDDLPHNANKIQPVGLKNVHVRDHRPTDKANLSDTRVQHFYFSPQDGGNDQLA